MSITTRSQVQVVSLRKIFQELVTVIDFMERHVLITSLEIILMAMYQIYADLKNVLIIKQLMENLLTLIYDVHKKVQEA